MPSKNTWVAWPKHASMRLWPGIQMWLGLGILKNQSKAWNLMGSYSLLGHKFPHVVSEKNKDLNVNLGRCHRCTR